MKNAEKFKEIFKEFATEVWAFPEKDFLEWLNAEYEEPTPKNNTVSLETYMQVVKERDIVIGQLHELGYEFGEKIEPATKNNLGVEKIVDVLGSYTDLDIPYKHKIAEDILNNLPSVTPQLSVPEVTALAEWTEKLTKASEDAYNKGYADGMKAQAEPRKGHWIEERNDYGEITNWHCSNCYDDSGFTTDCKWDYCPNCGSDNREVEE